MLMFETRSKTSDEKQSSAVAVESLGANYHTGMVYRDYVAAVVRRKAARNYMEIGVRDGACLSGIDVPTIGVDPAFTFTGNPVSGKRALHLFQMESDVFFRDHDPRLLFGGAPVDVSFLNGLHQFEFLLRDFINTERVSARTSVILLGDCLPVNVEMTERRHLPSARKDRALAGWWTGDVWKVVSILRTYRPDLKLTPFNTVPTGNVMVTNLDPSSTVLSDNYFAIVEAFREVELTHAGLLDFMAVNKPVDTAEMVSNLDFSLFFRP